MFMMKKTIFTLLLLFAQLSIINCQLSIASAQDLYIGSFYVTTADEEKLCGDGGDKWASRLPVIGDMFNFEQPDILGLQSLTESQLGQITKRLTNHNAAGDILYRKTLVLESSGTVDEMPEGSTCSWARLQKEGKSFYVFNICFASDANIALTSATRVRNAMIDINTENLPSFIVGYLGVNETKTAYSRLAPRHYDCYKQASIVSAEYGTVNNFNLEANHGTERYDFVFAPKTGITIQAYGQLQYGYFTKESDGTYKRRLPSTHFPVMARVRFQ